MTDSDEKVFTLCGTLFKNVKEEAICEKHGKYTRVLSWINGQQLGRSACPRCVIEREEEERRAAIERRRIEEAQAAKAKVEEALNRASVPSIFADRTLESFRTENEAQRRCLALAQRFVRGWDMARDGGYGLFFYGACGTGKSHLAIAILKALIETRGISGLYCRTADVIRAIRDTWSDRSKSESEVIKAFVDVDLLVLDEVGVQVGSQNEQQLLFAVIDSRIGCLRPTIFITNVPPNEIREVLGERLVDRIKERCVLCKFEGKSMRKPLGAEVFGD